MLETAVIRHIEDYLGTISYGFGRTLNQPLTELYVAAVLGKYDFNTYVTLGLSECDLNYKSLFELVFVCRKESGEAEQEIADFLFWFAAMLILQKKALKRGEAICLNRQICSFSQINAVYIAAPFYFDDGFQVLTHQPKSVVFPLLVPLYHQEAVRIRETGWQRFEDYLLENNVDNLDDLKREAFVW